MKILFYGETTKYAVHGVSVSNDLFLKDLRDKFNIIVIEEPSILASHGKVGLSKLTHYFKALRQAAKLTLSDSFDFFYSVLSLSVAGALKSLLMLLCIKILSPKTKLVTHIHRGDLSAKANASFVFRLLIRFALKLSYKVVLISRAQAKHYNEINAFGVCNYVYVANSIEIPDNFRRSPSDNTQYLYLSNYIKEKGIYDLLEVWKNLPKSFQLICFGGETPGTSIESLNHQFDIENIKLSKPILDVEKYQEISKAKGLILPSWNEGAPLVILEAMALGIPVIASDVGFVREMLGSDYPFLFEPKNKPDLEKTIRKFEMLTSLEAGGLASYLHKRFEVEFSRSQRVQDYLLVFQ